MNRRKKIIVGIIVAIAALILSMLFLGNGCNICAVPSYDMPKVPEYN